MALFGEVLESVRMKTIASASWKSRNWDSQSEFVTSRQIYAWPMELLTVVRISCGGLCSFMRKKRQHEEKPTVYTTFSLIQLPEEQARRRVSQRSGAQRKGRHCEAGSGRLLQSLSSGFVAALGINEAESDLYEATCVFSIPASPFEASVARNHSHSLSPSPPCEVHHRSRP